LLSAGVGGANGCTIGVCSSRSCVLKGSDDEVEVRLNDRAVPVMKVGPSGSPCRRRTQTTAVSCRLRAGVGSDCGKGSPGAGQVCDEKTNVCKPLLTHRNQTKTTSKPGKDLIFGMSQAAACLLAWWRPVYRWRELVVGAGMEQENLSSRCCPVWSVGLVGREGEPQAAETVRGRVPMRGTGAGRFVVAVKVL
jgi:hypothetical protein